MTALRVVGLLSAGAFLGVAVLVRWIVEGIDEERSRVAHGDFSPGRR